MREVLILVFVISVVTQCSAVEEDDGGEVVSITKNGFEKCKDINIKKLHVHGKVCIVVGYLSSEVGIELNITWNGKSVFHTKVSAKEPPAFCFKLPLLKVLQACLQLTDVSFKPHHHGACLALKIQALTFKKTFKLGCIYKTTTKTGTLLTDGYRAPRETDTLLGDWYEARLDGTSKTGHKDSKWIEVFGQTSKSRDMKPTSKNAEPAGKCSCGNPRKCMCCNFILQNKTKVCGRIICTRIRTGKALWLGLYVNNNKNFRVSTTVARRFTMVCGDPLVKNVTSSICLQFSKVQQTSEQLTGCITARIMIKTSHTNLDLGCFTLKHRKIDERLDDDLIRFVPPRVLETGISFL